MSANVTHAHKAKKQKEPPVHTERMEPEGLVAFSCCLELIVPTDIWYQRREKGVHQFALRANLVLH
jgi:hypothetical protein